MLQYAGKNLYQRKMWSDGTSAFLAVRGVFQALEGHARQAWVPHELSNLSRDLLLTKFDSALRVLETVEWAILGCCEPCRKG